MTATLPDLSHLARQQPLEQDPRLTWDEIRRTIERSIDETPRNLQVRIGPSELGTPCDACLIEKLAGHAAPAMAGMGWLSFVGTAVHEQLANFFTAANAGLPRARYFVETTVSVGEVGGVDITGHADLYDGLLAEVTDWKVVGETTLRKVKASGPGQTYRAQGHLYGRGFTRRGLPVKRIRIAFLPRNAKHIRNAVIHDEPYDEGIALAVLEHADMLARAIQTFGFDVVRAGASHSGDEFDCVRFEGATSSPATTGKGGRTAAARQTTAQLLA